jgi:hypothetical protein
MKHLLILIIFSTTILFGQTNPIKKYRAPFSPQTKIILTRLDSLMCPDSLINCGGQIESRTIGDGGAISERYLQYAELVKAATEKELLAILDNSTELSSIRGYALMAYVYKCDTEKRTEKHFNYKFKTMIQIGCEGSLCSYEQLYHKIRVRNFYDPNPKHSVMDPKEQEVIKQENKIRQEQELPLRKEQ